MEEDERKKWWKTKAFIIGVCLAVIAVIVGLAGDVVFESIKARMSRPDYGLQTIINFK